jgi:transposase-like protein
MDDLHKEQKATKSKTAQIQMPVCPYCKTKMKPFHYRGYYDSFVGWECECYEIPNAETQLGEYA